MTALDRYLDHLPEYKVIICRTCKYAVLSTGLQQHFKRHHLYVPLRTRLELVTQVQHLRGLAKSEEDVRLPNAIIAPIDALHLFTNGLACELCSVGKSYVCNTVKGMQKHCTQIHSWTGKQKKGEDERRTRPWRTGVACQRFFPRGSSDACSFFEVLAAPTGVEELSAGAGVQDLAAARRSVKARQDEELVSAGFARYSTETFLRRVGWKAHFSGLRMDWLYEQAQLPHGIKEHLARQTGDRLPGSDRAGPSEAAAESQKEHEYEAFVSQACLATLRLVKRSKWASQEEVIGRPSLEYIDRRDTGTDSNEGIFYVDHTRTTILTYAKRFMRMTAYILRTYRLPSGERPPYLLDKHQLQAIERLYRHWRRCQTPRIDQDELESGMVDRCRHLWIRLLDYRVGDRVFDSVMVSAASVLGIVSGRFMSASQYSPVIASIITVSKMMVLFTAYTEREDRVRQLKEQKPDLPEEEVNRQVGPYSAAVRRMVDKFMVITAGGEPGSTMNTLLRVKSYARTVAGDTNSEGNVTWGKTASGSDQLTVLSKTIDMDGLRAMIRRLCDRLEEKMKRLLFVTSLPDLDLRSLHDNLAQQELGWSFVKDARNKNLLIIDGVAGCDWLYARAKGNGQLSGRFGVRDGDGFQWHENAVEDYLRANKDFKERLLVLAHLTGGAPARGTELPSIQHRNAADNPTGRGVFIEHGLVVFTPTWSKTYGHTRKAKNIHRYLPVEVSRLVVYYLWLVLPFVEAIQLLHFRQESLSDYIWESEHSHTTGNGREEDPWAISGDADVSKSADEDEDGDEDIRELEELMEIDDSKRIRAKEGTDPYRQEARNPDGFYDTDRIRRLIQREFKEGCMETFGIQQWRHAYPAIQRRFSSNDVVHNALDVIYLNQPARQNFGSLASGHDERTEAAVYGRDVSENIHFRPTDRARYRTVSVDWHVFLGFPSALALGGCDLSREDHLRMEASLIRDEAVRQKTLALMDVDEALRQIIGDPRAMFRAGQRKALKTILEGTPRILAILPTGAGKSVLYNIPASHPCARTTIVVVPTIALRLDCKRKSVELGIAHAVYTGFADELPYQARLIFVTPESATGDAFLGFIRELVARRSLDRIVIDECHKILDSVEKATWRPKVLELARLHRSKVQIVYLTGSLSPADEAAFFTGVGLDRDVFQVIRTPTRRRNIAYTVLPFVPGPAGKDQVIADIIRQRMQHRRQCIIYCVTIKQCEALADTLGCPVFVSSLAERTKRRILEGVATGDIEMLVATTAVGEGVDLPHVDVVIYAGLPLRVRDFVQGSGRAGRKGQSSLSILLVEYGRDGQVRTTGGNARVESSMIEYATTTGCKRLVLDMVMDGNTGSGPCNVADGEEACSSCVNSNHGPAEDHKAAEDCGSSEDNDLATIEDHDLAAIHDDDLSIITQCPPRHYPQLERPGKGQPVLLAEAPLPRTPIRTTSNPTLGAVCTTPMAVTPAARQIVTPAAGQIVTPSARQIVTPSARQIVTPSARQAVTPAARQTVTPAAGQTVTPAAGQTITPVSRQTASVYPLTPVSLDRMNGRREREEYPAHSPAKRVKVPLGGFRPARDVMLECGRDREQQLVFQRGQNEMQQRRVEMSANVRTVEQNEANTGFVSMLETLSGSCIICRIRDGTGEETHRWEGCANTDAVEALKLRIKRLSNPTIFKLARFSACFYCWLPLEVCSRQDQSTSNGKPVFQLNQTRSCTNRDLMKTIIAALGLWGGAELDAVLCKVGVRPDDLQRDPNSGEVVVESLHNLVVGQRRPLGAMTHCHGGCVMVWEWWRRVWT